MLWDVFISHAREDKESVARPLATLLKEKGLRVWLDEQQLKVGDSLSAKINDGLAFSRFGIVILSPAFFRKDYPQRELQSLLSRQTSRERYILPVLHDLEHSELKKRVPLIADLLAISTEGGLDAVANELRRSAIDDVTPSDSSATPRYFSAFAFPDRLLPEAIGAISSLELPHTWPHLEPARDMSNPTIWMGTDAEVMVTLCFYLYAPIVHFGRLRYALERTLSTLSIPERVRFGLLDSSLRALGEDSAIAAAEPALRYAPRCSDWRQKRAVTPQQFWWQGLTLERFEKAAPLFYSSGDIAAEPDLHHFRSAYAAGYGSCGQAQQTLGLLANPLYGFTPKSRPVYWRLLMLWKCLYVFLNGFRTSQAENTTTEEVLSGSFISSPEQLAVTPDSALPESPDSTVSALFQYYNEFIRPRMRTYLVSVQAKA
ncbi:MAG TPA: toll/interleukin-1 receptor domain-containing protein [Chthoniobacterales bacterium]|nr:toll/interleukin-1 receptor domain-containing protein [Chthoniobacterales bacterium]